MSVKIFRRAECVEYFLSSENFQLAHGLPPNTARGHSTLERAAHARGICARPHKLAECDSYRSKMGTRAIFQKIASYFYGVASDKGLIATITSHQRCPNRIARAA
jgi:hypothetical protein